MRSITAVEGLPAEGAAFTLPAESYAIDIDAEGNGWVRVTTPGAAGRVRVTYLAGLADDWDRLPEPLRQGVVRLALPEESQSRRFGVMWLRSSARLPLIHKLVECARTVVRQRGGPRAAARAATRSP